MSTRSRRADKRLNVKEGAFAVLFEDSAKMGQILDISLGGFSFQYSDSQFIDNDRSGRAFLYNDLRKSLKGMATFDIFLVDSGIYLNQMPCTIISNVELDDEDSTNLVPMKRCGIKFDELGPEQISDLGYFIEKCTTESYSPNVDVSQA